MNYNYNTSVSVTTTDSETNDQSDTKRLTTFKRFMFLMAFLYIGMFSMQAQTTLISPTGDGGFETGSTLVANGWTAVNASTDGWQVGTAPVVATGTNCGYVSANGGAAWTYSQLSTFTHIYRDVTIPAGENKLTLNFKWKATGEGTTTSDWDNLKIFLAPTSVTPTTAAAVTGATQLSGAGAISGMYKLNSAAWNSESIVFSGTPGTTYRLIFSWKSDGSTIANPPAALDDISLVSSMPGTITATAMGGLWSSPATWVGGIVPSLVDSVVIPAGSLVTTNVATTANNVSVDGQLNQTTAALNVIGNLIISPTGKYFINGQVVNIGGNFTNNGFANLAAPSSAVLFNGSQVGGSLSQTFDGSGTFAGNAAGGIIRSLNFQTTGSCTVNTTQNLVVTAGLGHTAGSLNTNGKITIDNTAQIYGQALNQQVAYAYISNMGAGYANAPVVFGAAATLWTASATATLNTRYFSGNNVYIATTAGTFDAATAPTHSTGIVTNGTAQLLWLGTLGTLGTPFQQTAVTVGTQYFYGSNLYVCTVAGVPAAASPPIHTTGTALSGVATFLYVGSPAVASLNYDSVTQTVRSINITNAGMGYSSFPAAVISPNGAAPTTAATAFVIQYQSIGGLVNSLVQKSGVATISGGLTINSDQGATAFSGVGNIFTTNGGVNYTVAPTVGFSGPTAINLVTAGGSGYTTAPTVVISGGTFISGTAYTSASFTITVAQGKVVSVYLTGAATYSVPPTLTITGGGGSGATLEFPSGCWPSATAVIGSNGQITNFTTTNAGFGYNVAPTVSVAGGVSGSALGGTFTTVATAPTARLGLYNLTIGYFIPAVASVVNNEGVEIPSNRKINAFIINNPTGAIFTGNLSLLAIAPLTLTSGILNFGTNTLSCESASYTGQTGSATASVSGIIRLNTIGGSLTRTFPFDASVVAVMGTGSLATGSTVTSLTASRTPSPSGTVSPSGATKGSRAYRLLANSGAVYGTNPTVQLNFNATDALTSDNASLYIGQAAALTGTWTVRSLTSGTGALPTTGARTTGTTAAPEIIIPTGDDYYAWTSTLITYQSAQTGDWNVPTTWLGGVVPPTGTCEEVFIMNTHNVTVNSAGNIAKNLTINTGGTLTVASGDLTIGCTNNNNSLSNNGTLTVSGGTLSVNGSVLNTNGSTFNQSGGDINVDGNSGVAGTSLPITADMFAFGTSGLNYTTGTIAVTGGNLNIINPHFTGTATATGGAAFAFRGGTTGRTFAPAHITKFGPATKASTAVSGYFVDCYVNSALLMFGSVNVNSGTGSFAVQTNALSGGGGLNCAGDLTIASGAELLDLNVAGQGVSVAGNITNNGTFTQTNATGLRMGLMSGTTGTTFGVTTVAQTIGGSGVFRNLAAANTANLTAFAINNSNAAGVTLNVPLSVSGTTNLILGKVNTTAANLLTLGTATTAGVLVGGSATAYVDGPMSRRFATRASAATYDLTTLFPVGKGTAYLPLHLAPTTTAAGLNLQAEAFTTNTGTFANPIGSMAVNRWETTILAGAMTDVFVRENDAAVVATSEILVAPAAAGLYARILPTVTTVVAGTSLTTATALTTAGFLSYGKVCTTPAAPTGTAAQSFCNAGTVANLTATGTGIQWYAAATGGTALLSTDALVDGTHYFASQTVVGGCESATRFDVTATINTTAAPTGTAAQSFCNSGTVANLVATGTAIQWYAAATGGTALLSTDALVSGNHYFASQTISGCESATRFDVTATINVPAAPTGTAAQTFCNSGTVANLTATGTMIQWYVAATGGTALLSTDALVSGNHYFASQTISGCESATRFDVTATINVPAAPTGTAAQSFCNSGTVANLVATGTMIQWYAAATGGTALLSTDALVSGTHYYASQTVSGCESATRFDVTVTIDMPAAPTGTAAQSFCNSGTVANLVATGTAIQWYAAATGGTALLSTDALVSGNHYFASQTISGCESATRFDVTVTIDMPAAPTGTAAQSFCNSGTVANLVATGTAIQWYAAATGGTALLSTDALVSGNHYFASQTISGCESATRFDVTVTIVSGTLTVAPTTATVCEGVITTITSTGGYQGVINGKIGAGAVGSATTTPFKGFWGGHKTQSIYTAAELSAKGLANGSVISSIGYVVSAGTPLLLNNFVVNAGLVPAATTLATATGFIAGASNNVFTNAAYTPPTGVGNIDYSLGTPIVWDGTSSLLVETCFNNNNGGGVTANSLIVETSTVAAGLIMYRSQDNIVDVCSNVTTPTASTTRPNLRMTFTAPVVTWAPVTNLFTDAAATVAYVGGSSAPVVYARPSATTTYTATSTSGACTLTATSAITVNSTVAPTASSQTFCAATTVANLVATGTGTIQWYAAASGGTALAPATAITTGTYYASQTVAGCESFSRAASSVLVNALTPLMVAPATATICEGAIQTITATGGAISASDKIGTGTTGSTTSTPYKGFWGGQKTQALYTAAELTAKGFVVGTKISSLGYVVTAGTPLQLNDFTVKAGLVSATALSTATGFIAGASNTVFTNATYTPPTGTGNIDYTLASPIVWDGTSSLLIETCFNNNNGGGVTANSLTTQFSTVANGLFMYRSEDNIVDVCTNLTVPTASTARPNLRMTYTAPDTVWSPITNLYTDAAATVAYVANANATTVYAKPSANMTYTATMTSGTCSVSGTSVITVTVTPAPTGTAAQSFCNSGTVAGLMVTGTGIQWYAAATGGTALASTTALVSGTHYYASQTVAGCESLARFDVTATINVTAAPTGTAAQPFCGTATVVNLIATGTGIQWYAAATGGTALLSTDALVSGNHYYASQTISGCESATRFDVTATVNPIPAAPTGTAAQAFCNTTSPTVASLSATGTGTIQWYAAATGGTALANTVALVDGTHYFASQTVSGCESATRFDVTATVNSATCPVIDWANYQWPNTASMNNCGSTTAYAQVYKAGVTEAAGQGAGITAWIGYNTTNSNPNTWVAGDWHLATFNVQSGNNDEYQYAITGLPAGTYYIASRFQSGSGAYYYGGYNSTGGGAWDGTANVSGVLTVTAVAAPTGTASQTYCAGETVSLIAATGTGIIWYDMATGGAVVPGSTLLVSGTTYYASQTVSGCESPTRLAVTMTLGSCLGTNEFDSTAFSYYPNPTTDILNLKYSEELTSVKVSNILGQDLFTKTINATETQLDMSNLPTGTYLIEVTAGDVSKTIKVVKK